MQKANGTGNAGNHGINVIRVDGHCWLRSILLGLDGVLTSPHTTRMDDHGTSIVDR